MQQDVNDVQNKFLTQWCIERKDALMEKSVLQQGLQWHKNTKESILECDFTKVLFGPQNLEHYLGVLHAAPYWTANS